MGRRPPLCGGICNAIFTIITTDLTHGPARGPSKAAFCRKPAQPACALGKKGEIVPGPALCEIARPRQKFPENIP